MKIRKIVSILIVLTLFLFPVFIRAADGSGTCTVSTVPAHIYEDTTGNQLTFTFTAAESMNSGAIRITAPSGWSAPQGTSGTAGYTTAASTGTLGKVANNMDSISNWENSASTTVAQETANKIEGDASVKITFGATATSGEIAYYATTSAQNWSSYSKIGIWLYSSSTQAANGDLQFGIASTTNFSNAQFVNIATSTVNTWVFHVLDISGISSDILSSVQSYGIKYAVDYFGTSTGDIYLDEMLIGPDNVNALSFSGQTVTARILELATSSTITINYGSGGGSSGVTAPSICQVYTFDTKSKIAVDGTLTSIATSPTITVYCVIPLIDNLPPSTKIEAPVAGEEISAGKAYAIKGTSIDTGGSTVKEVKISLDGGVAWELVTPLKSTDSGFTWKYIWLAPVVGDYTIWAKATDWVGNIETPGAKVSIKVKTIEVPPEEVVPPEEEAVPPEEVAPPEKPIAEMTVEEIKAKIVEIQQKIVELLTQLIKLIQAQIAELLVK